jgi:glyoxylase-like metal-dependent hydrolase (beta-lactamase superfamily II)
MVEEVLPSLYRVVVPLPGSPLKEVNSYVLTAPDRNLVIDTGMNRPECLEALESGLAEIGIDLDQTDFLATHLHADHHGLIPTLLKPGRRAFMGAIDAGHMRHGMGWSTDSPMGRYMARSGFPADDLIASFQNHPGFKFRPDRVVEYEKLYEGDVVEIGQYRLRVIDTPGHTSGHISLYDPTCGCSSPATTSSATSRPTSRPGRTTTIRWRSTWTAWRRWRRWTSSSACPATAADPPVPEADPRADRASSPARRRDRRRLTADGPRNAYDTAARMRWDIARDRGRSSRSCSAGSPPARRSRTCASSRSRAGSGGWIRTGTAI